MNSCHLFCTHHLMDSGHGNSSTSRLVARLSQQHSKNSQKLNSRPVYCSRLYGKYRKPKNNKIFICLVGLGEKLPTLPSPKVSTTPLRLLGFRQWGFWQCLLFSWTTLRDKHCRHPITVMGVVDTFRTNHFLHFCLAFFILSSRTKDNLTQRCQNNLQTFNVVSFSFSKNMCIIILFLINILTKKE